MLAALIALLVQAAAPYAIAPGLFDTTSPDLGLRPMPQAETVTIFRPGDGDDHFNNGVVLIGFKGRLYAQWQASPRDEDSPDTRVLWSESSDGRRWSKPRVLVSAGRDGTLHSSGGWWTDGETLIAYVNVWPTGFQSGAGGYATAMTSRDGRHWSAPRRLTSADGKPVEGIIEQDPRTIADGRILTAFHLRPGLTVAPYFTDDPLGLTGWRRGAMDNLPHNGNVTREIEPSSFVRRDGCVVMVFRDQAESFRQLASESCDRGARWTLPALTAMLDSRSKQSAGNLPDGSAYLVNAPARSKERIPLAITLSDDGHHFTRSYLLRGRAELPPIRTPGQFKRLGYHYPKSVIWKDHLYVGYATNKERVELTRIPIAALEGRSR